MTAKFWISAAVMFVTRRSSLSWLVHGGLLHGDYMKMLSSMRKPDETHALIRG